MTTKTKQQIDIIHCSIYGKGLSLFAGQTYPAFGSSYKKFRFMYKAMPSVEAQGFLITWGNSGNNTTYFKCNLRRGSQNYFYNLIFYKWTKL